MVLGCFSKGWKDKGSLARTQLNNTRNGKKKYGR